MQCRMCSQRLTRPGKLCRECERELDRARAAAASVDDLSSAVPLIDAGGRTTAESIGWPQLRSRPTVLVMAFSVGLATAVAVYAVRGSHVADKPASVMIDRDLSHVRPREARPPALPPSHSGTAKVASMAVVSHQADAAFDRVLGLADALDRCARELPFARMTCEHRARTHYCTAPGSNRIPQCAAPAGEAATRKAATPNLPSRSP